MLISFHFQFSSCFFTIISFSCHVFTFHCKIGIDSVTFPLFFGFCARISCSLLFYSILFYSSSFLCGFHSTLFYSIPFYSLLRSLPFPSLFYCTPRSSTLLYSTLLYSTLLYSVLLYSTLLYSTLSYPFPSDAILFYPVLCQFILSNAISVLLYSIPSYSFQFLFHVI